MSLSVRCSSLSWPVFMYCWLSLIHKLAHSLDEPIHWPTTLPQVAWVMADSRQESHADGVADQRDPLAAQYLCSAAEHAACG